TSSKQALDWLTGKLQEQRKQVEDSELAAQKYREQNNPVPAEDRGNIIVQKLTDLSTAVTRAKTERIAKEAQYQQLLTLRGNPAALGDLPAVMSNSFVQDLKRQLVDLQRQQAQLSEKLGEKHPDMVKLNAAVQTIQARLGSEIEKAVAAVQNEFQAAGTQERNLSAALEAQKQEALALNRKAIDYGVLQRDAASNRQIFDSLMQRMKEAGIAG